MAINKQGVRTTKTFSLKITGTIKITTAKLVDAEVGKKYKVTLKASGATSYTWAATSPLPAGLTLSSKGVLSGIPVKANDGYSINVRVLDAYGGYTDKNFSLNIFGKPSITTMKLKNATVGKSYEYKFEGTCSTDIKWCAYNRLPPGLMLTSDGVLSGTPACTGSYTVCVRAVNSYGEYVDKSFNLSVGGNEKNSAIVFDDLTVGKKYEDYFDISFYNTLGSIKLSKNGTMPKGLSLSLKGTTVYVKGTPQESGIFRVKVTLKDEAGKSVYKYISLTVQDTLKITTGKTLTNGKVYKKYSKQLKATGSDSFVWFAWNMSSGLTLSPSGVLSGTPLYEDKYYDFWAEAYTAT